MFKEFLEEDIAGKRVILRLDLNVTIANGKIQDLSRIKQNNAFVKKILSYSPKYLLIITHLGRPNSKTLEEADQKLSLRNVTDAIQDCFNLKINFIDKPYNDVLNELSQFQNGEVILLENLRFNPQEEECDDDFSKLLASFGDVYINNAFSVSHRNHASTYGITKHIPSYAGDDLIKEVEMLTLINNKPTRPILAIIGGSKVASKIDLFTVLRNKVDYLFIAGAMANTFLKAQKINIGDSFCENDKLDLAANIIEEYKKSNTEILLPQDVKISTSLENINDVKQVDVNSVLNGYKIFDAGIVTFNHLRGLINECKTVIWNGPLGVYEYEPFDEISVNLAKHIANRTKKFNLISIAGGGDTVGVLNKANVMYDFSYATTAGGAFLEFLEGKELKAINVLK